MPNPYIDDSFFWYWYEWTFPVIVAVIALSVGLWIFLTTDRAAYGTIVRTLAVAAFLGTLPLGEERIGIGVSATNDAMAVLSLLGGGGAIAIGVIHFLAPGRRKRRINEPDPGVPPADATVAFENTAHQGGTPGSEATSRRPRSREPVLETAPDLTMAGVITRPPPATQSDNVVLLRPPAWLVFQNGNSAGQTIPLGIKTSIGRGESSDIVLEDPEASSDHAEIRFADGAYALTDLGSSSGTLVEGSVTRSTVALDSGATIRIGKTDLIFMQGGGHASRTTQAPSGSITGSYLPGDSTQTVVGILATESAPNSWLAITDGPSRGVTLEITGRETRIGRSELNDLVVSDAGVSRNHAVLIATTGGMHLVDLASSGGTQINRRPLEPTRLSLSSVIAVGDTELTVKDPGSAANELLAGSSDATVVVAPAQAATEGDLVVSKGPDTGASFHLHNGDNLIGRGPVEISLSDPRINERHAVIRKSGDNLIVYDLGSDSGTLADGKSAAGQPLDAGDTIFLGGSTISVIGAVTGPRA